MINMDLFSELRTIYETTLLDPHTYRITIKMKDIIDGKLRELPFSTQATCFRGMVTLQSDVDMVQDEIREYQEFVEILRTLPGHAERQAYCLQRMAERSRCITATVSYAGKANFGEVERYIQEFEALPSTALPSTHVPLTIEMSALNVVKARYPRVEPLLRKL